MGLSEKYKRKLNVLIPYYRKQFVNETKDGKWQQTAFYTDDNTKLPVCSSAIYSGLENQKLIVRDEVYEFAAKKLHKSCEENGEIEKSFECLVDKIYHLMEFKEETECIKVLEKVLPVLDEVCKGVLVYEEYLWFFNMLHDFFVSRDNIMGEVEFSKLDLISSIFDGKFHDLVICYLYIYANFNEYDKVAYVLDKYDYEKSDFISNKIYVLNLYEKNQEAKKALDFIESMITQMENTYNYKRLPILYVKMSKILRDFDVNEAKRYLDKAVYLIAERRFERNQLFVLYLDIAALYMEKEEYELSIKYHKLALTIAQRAKIHCYACICHSYRMLNKKIPNEYLSCDEIRCGDSVDWSVYYFFCSYSIRTAHENIKYILKKVAPLLKNEDWIYIIMFDRELRMLCKQIRGYKSLYEFQAYFSKNNGKK